MDFTLGGAKSLACRLFSYIRDKFHKIGFNNALWGSSLLRAQWCADIPPGAQLLPGALSSWRRANLLSGSRKNASSRKIRGKELETLLKWSDHCHVDWLTDVKLTGQNIVLP